METRELSVVSLTNKLINLNKLVAMLVQQHQMVVDQEEFVTLFPLEEHIFILIYGNKIKD